MGRHSSRENIFHSITVEQSQTDVDGTEHVRVGKLYLVVLQGSERIKKTHAAGERLKEASKIGMSLSSFGNVISALVDGKSKHIPYRDSKTTRLLQYALGGNCKTLMVATIGPADQNYDETISTLRYARRASSVKNCATIRMDPAVSLLVEYQKQITELHEDLGNGDSIPQPILTTESGVSAPPSLGTTSQSVVSVPPSLGTTPQSGVSALLLLGTTSQSLDDDVKGEEDKDIVQTDQAEGNANTSGTGENKETMLKCDKDEKRDRLAYLEKKILIGGTDMHRKT